MKFPVFSCILLLPLVVTGKKESATTENWENDESYTLHREDSTHPPRNYGSPIKVSLAGPYDKSTTEDPILPLILRKLMEDGLNNELDDEGHKKKTTENATGSKTPSFPLTYMTPPAVFISPSSKPATSSEEDDEIISTTIAQDSSGEITTTDSSEIDDFDTTTPLPLIKFVVNNNNNNNQRGQDGTLKNNMNSEQYAPKFQKYYVPKGSPSTETIQETATTPEGEVEDASPQTQPQEPDSDHLSGREEEDLDQSTTTITPENQDEQGQINMTPPPPTTESEPRPVYYFFLRPKSRNPMFPSDMSNDNDGMIPPRSFNEDMSYRPYPQQQGMMMNYPNRVYKFPSFIAQDYESQQQTAPSSFSYNSLSPPYYNNYNDYPSPMGSNAYPQYYYFQQRSQPMNPFFYQQRGNPYMTRQSPMFSPIPYNDVSRMDQFNNNAGDNYYYRGGPNSYYASSDLVPRSYNNYRVPPFYPSYNNAAVESSNYAPSYNNYYPRPMGFNSGMAPRYYGINN